MSKTKTFDKKFLKDELDLPYGAIEDKIIDNSRWSIFREIIFEFNSKYYKTSYSVGATEMQDESPWEYDDTIVCTEVEEKEVLAKQWVDVE